MPGSSLELHIPHCVLAIPDAGDIDITEIVWFLVGGVIGRVLRHVRFGKGCGTLRSVCDMLSGEKGRKLGVRDMM